MKKVLLSLLAGILVISSVAAAVLYLRARETKEAVALPDRPEPEKQTGEKISEKKTVPSPKKDTAPPLVKATEPEPDPVKIFGDSPLKGHWVLDPKSVLPIMDEETVKEPILTPDKTYFVSSGLFKEKSNDMSYGAALNLKYYSGISYDYLRENLPGKTISVTVNVPEEAISPKRFRPNGLRLTVKSVKDGEWGEFSGEASWIDVSKAGDYPLKLTIPTSPTKTDWGTTFYPDRTILFIIEYVLMDGTRYHDFTSFSFRDIEIEGIPLDPSELKWQLVINGYAKENEYIEGFPRGSTYLDHIGTGLGLIFKSASSEEKGRHAFSGLLEGFFLSLDVYVPKELRNQKGTIALTVRDKDGNVRSSVKNFNSSNLNGKVFLTIPMDVFSVKSDLEEITENLEIDLKIKTLNPHTSEMMPMVISPLELRQGELVTFDAAWEVRDVQGLGGYTGLDVREDGIVGDSGIAVKTLEKDNYQLDTTMKLKGGIDWENPYYKVELVKPFENAPVDLDNMHLEVLINPLTDTTDVWQRPFRARIGLMDVNGAVMFGPNVSLSEGLPSLATLDVSLTNPMPKGLVTPGFDPEKVSSLILNVEGSHGPTEIRNLSMSFVDFTIQPREYTRVSPAKNIDFGRFPRKPESWYLTKRVKETGGYFVGMNYPFAVLDVPVDVLKVPQVYPAVGRKPTDPKHLGFSSELTYETTYTDFKTFAEHDLDVVRLFVFGHLEGVFTWDERGDQISGLTDETESLFREMAGMSVERMAEFLNSNEDRVFQATERSQLPGVEKHVLKDLTALLEILEKIEQDTGKRITVMLSLFDFLLGDGTSKEGPLRMYKVGEHANAVTDPVMKTRVLALTWKILKEMAKDPRFYRYVSVVEIMNEPANATALATKKHFVDLLNFCGEGLYLLKDAIGPTIPVSIGFRSWPEDLRYWEPIGEGVDVLMIHYWESLESYNIDKPGLWPLDLPAEQLWKFLGTEPEGRLVGMGEIGPIDGVSKNLFRLEKAGYDFSLIWSYSGHDSYDAKPYMDDIKDYQEGDALFGAITEKPSGIISQAFDLLLDAGKDYNSPSFSDFKDFISGRLSGIQNPDTKDTISKILEVLVLKKIPVNTKNLLYLKEKALSNLKQ